MGYFSARGETQVGGCGSKAPRLRLQTDRRERLSSPHLSMARRANSGIRPLWIIVAFGALAVAIAVGVLLQNGGGDPYRTVPALDLGDYLNNANSLRGNVYKLKGQITQSLGYSRAKGRLFSVTVDDDVAARGSNGRDVVPILVPSELGYLNLQKGQRYTFRLEVGAAGILKALDMRKS